MLGLTYEEIKIGDKASTSKTVSEHDIYQFAGITGDFNRLHVDAEFAKESVFKERVAHGMLSAGFISNVLAMKLPGKGTIYLSQNLNFKGPVMIGDTVTAEVEVMEKKDKHRIIRLKTIVRNQRDEIVIDGEAVIMKS